MVAINFLSSPRRQTIRITHSQTKDGRRSILAPSVSICPFVRPSLSIPPSSFAGHLGSATSTLWQAGLPLGGRAGGERVAGTPVRARAPRPGGASPAAAVTAVPRRARGRERGGPGPSAGPVWAGADRAGIPGRRPGERVAGGQNSPVQPQ